MNSTKEKLWEKGIKRFIKIISIQIGVFLLFLELGSFIASKNGLLLYNLTPKIYWDPSCLEDYEEDTKGFLGKYFGYSEKDPWGVWHVPDRTIRQSKLSFDIKKTFNEIGARDQSFQEIPAESLLLLGDSFAEGWGVRYENTSQFILEQLMGHDVLNMGCSYCFGPLQQLMLYQNFKYLPHSGVIVYILPGNDFIDNDSRFFNQPPDSPNTNADYRHYYRYRPYFGSSENPLEPFYFPQAVKRYALTEAQAQAQVKVKPSTFYSTFREFILHNFWSGNTFRTLFEVLFYGDLEYLDPEASLTNISYYNDNQEQQRNLVLAHKEIVKVSEKRDVLFVIIPWQEDIRQYKLRDLPDSYKQSLWYRRLKDLTATNGRKISVLDLIEHLPEDTDRLFFSNDPHWNPHGNRWAAKAIYQHIKENGLFTPKESK